MTAMRSNVAGGTAIGKRKPLRSGRLNRIEAQMRGQRELELENRAVATLIPESLSFAGAIKPR